MLAIIYFEYNYLGERISVENKDRRFLKLPAFDNEEELKEWVEETERKIAKEICEKVSSYRSNGNVYITNIVRL